MPVLNPEASTPAMTTGRRSRTDADGTPDLTPDQKVDPTPDTDDKHR